MPVQMCQCVNVPMCQLISEARLKFQWNNLLIYESLATHILKSQP